MVRDDLPQIGNLEIYITKAYSTMMLTIDTIFKTHQPFLWSVNAGIQDDITDPQSPISPATILFYSVSGDGSHVATLSTKSKLLQLDMWDLGTAPCSMNPPRGIQAPLMDASIERRAPFSPKSCGQYRTFIECPVATDTCKERTYYLLITPSSPR